MAELDNAIGAVQSLEELLDTYDAVRAEKSRMLYEEEPTKLSPVPALAPHTHSS